MCLEEEIKRVEIGKFSINLLKCIGDIVCSYDYKVSTKKDDAEGEYSERDSSVASSGLLEKFESILTSMYLGKILKNDSKSSYEYSTVFIRHLEKTINEGLSNKYVGKKEVTRCYKVFIERFSKETGTGTEIKESLKKVYDKIKEEELNLSNSSDTPQQISQDYGYAVRQ